MFLVTLLTNLKNYPEGKGEHCCEDMNLAINWNPSIGFEDGSYSLALEGNFCDGPCLNFCPFCGTVLPGALVTNWELHKKCEHCHWTGHKESAKMPPCVCSKGYEELKRAQDEANKSN